MINNSDFNKRDSCAGPVLFMGFVAVTIVMHMWGEARENRADTVEV